MHYSHNLAELWSRAGPPCSPLERWGRNPVCSVGVKIQLFKLSAGKDVSVSDSVALSSLGSVSSSGILALCCKSSV